jgi:hypothetical protein
MVIKTWSIKNPLLGGVLIASTLSQAARAAELPASQPLPIPGIPTPDQAVRRMATNMVLDSRSVAALSSSTGITPNRPISALPLTAGLPDSSQVLSSCPNNVCGLVATQPPVTLGTALPSGINKPEQSKFTNLITSTTNVSPKFNGVTPSTITPSNQITNSAQVSLSTEPGLSKDIAFGQTGTKPAKTAAAQVSLSTEPGLSKDIAFGQTGTKPAETQITANQASPPKIAYRTTANQAIGIGNVQNQVTSFTGQLAANSWKLITVLPKPKLDFSLLNIGSSRSFQQYDLLSFSPRLTLGASVKIAPSTKVGSSFSASPLFTTQEPIAKLSPAVIQWNQSSLFAKPLNDSKPKEFITDKGFSNFNHFELSTKPFNIGAFLATVRTSAL